MKTYKDLLTSAVQIVVFLTTAFGGFLKEIAPPIQTGASFATGVLSFFILIMLLIISALARSRKGNRGHWIKAGIAAFLVSIPAAFIYPHVLGQYTWWYPPNQPIQRVRGSDSDFSATVRDFLASNKDASRTPEQLARNFEIDEIWTPESLAAANIKLLVSYAWLVLSLATAIFCLIEANVHSAGTGRSVLSRRKTNARR